MEEYRRAIRSDPRSVSAHIDFGNALLADGRYAQDERITQRRYEEAIDQFRRAVDLDQQSAVAHDGLGRALYRLAEMLPTHERDRKNNLRQASAKAFAKVVELDPDYEDAYFNLGNALRRQGYVEDANEAYRNAGEHYKMAVDRDRSNATAYRKLGRQLLNEGSNDRAIEVYSEAIKIEPLSPSPMNTAAMPVSTPANSTLQRTISHLWPNGARKMPMPCCGSIWRAHTGRARRPPEAISICVC